MRRSFSLVVLFIAAAASVATSEAPPEEQARATLRGDAVSVDGEATTMIELDVADPRGAVWAAIDGQLVGPDGAAVEVELFVDGALVDEQQIRLGQIDSFRLYDGDVLGDCAADCAVDLEMKLSSSVAVQVLWDASAGGSDVVMTLR